MTTTALRDPRGILHLASDSRERFFGTCIPCAWILLILFSSGGRILAQSPANGTSNDASPAVSGKPAAKKSPAGKGSVPVSPKRRIQAPSAGQWQTFDMVIAIIENKIITLSEVRPTIQAEIAKAEERAQARDPNARMKPQEKAWFMQSMAWNLAQKKAHELQQLGSIKDLPVPEERVQQVIEDNVRRRIEKDQRLAGSAMALYDNLKAQGKTFAEYRAELRDQITLSIIQSQIFTKYMDGGNLKVTPAEMWDYYRQHSKEYKRDAKAKVEIYRLRLNKDEAAALAQAGELRRELLSGGERKQLARKYRAFRHIQEFGPEDGHLAILTDFAFDTRNQVGAWSEPQVDGDFVYIIHLESRLLGGLKGFKEIGVQRDIRSKILRSRLLELEVKLQQTKAKNLSIWPPNLMTSQTPSWPR